MIIVLHHTDPSKIIYEIIFKVEIKEKYQINKFGGDDKRKYFSQTPVGVDVRVDFVFPCHNKNNKKKNLT